MKQSKLDRYGTLGLPSIAVAKNGSISKRTCALCGKEFEPESVRQVYCKDKHFGPCPVCGKQTEIKDYNIGVQCCSIACKVAKNKSNLFSTCKGTSNEDLMIRNGWLPVYDCGQKVFTYFPQT